MPPRELLLSPVRHAQGELTLPGSKSISNRVLLLAALAQGSTRIQGLLKSDDTDVMLAALTTLGVPIHRVSDSEVIVTGVPDWRTLGSPLRTSNTSHTSQIHTDLFLGNAGTAFRPLTAALAVWGGDYVLRGVPRMHERPIGDLVDALRQWGASVEYLEQPGFPPLQIGLGRLQQAFSCQEIDSVRDPQTNPIVNRQPNLEPRQHLNSTTASRIHVKGSVSSQFLTALLMVAPIVAKQTQQAVEIEVMGTLISKPYIEITVNLMARFGVQVQRVGEQIYRIEPQAQYVSPGRLEVEGDASSASYFMALGLIGGGPVVVKGVDEHSIQGDVQFVSVLKAMGAQVTCGPLSIQTQRASEVSGVTRATTATSTTNITNTIGKGPFGKLRAFDLDFNLIPDAAMTAAVLAIYADGPCTLRNIASWRVKETDRIHAMQTELTKLGARVQSGEDWLTVWPIEEHAWRSARIHTYDDHRMAMCFSLAAFGPVPITILDPGCVAKTFPDYFTVYERLVSA